jgi:hypothetical protein
MLTQLFPFLDPAHITPDLGRRLRALADDCDRLQLRCSISPILLRSAPLLEDWLPAMTPEGVRLIGYASGHPIHGDRMVMTTALWWAGRDGTWVRTLSRFYRLGRPAHPDDVRRLLISIASSSRNGDDGGWEDRA